ncbi:CubicO group peptidase, beta-lactamase class C family [Pedobacter westerhofensis]|uniref:CubicO group peptidase, beta-lactamase class C family n=1 Tax=Pedobacter westerhofensis TaxID=425512 RepID=A0A521FTT4_9SPHI|nr:serine hydrolase domain-containing protein [Pedobacter westerhofensis]SMO99556.1 CubicO group peptidase, beta-lactamase class C family [Pedobacter westerhofensis]
MFTMKKGCFLIFRAIMLCLISIPCWSQPEKLLTDNPLRDKLDRVVQAAATDYMANPGTVGLSIAIYKDGRRLMYNYGESTKGTGQLIKANQLFNLGSVAKTFIGIMLAQAVIDKRATLQDDIRKYLPGKYPNLQYEGRSVRLIDIANHTSGLPKSSRNFPAKIMDSIKNISLPKQLDFFSKYNQDTLMKDMHKFKLETLPGTKYEYNGNAMTILILLLERIYHQQYELLVTNYLKNHLGLYDTRTKIPVNQLNRFIQGYKDASRPVQWYDLTNDKTNEINTNLFYPGGPSMNSTMADMLKYLIANVEETDPAIRLSHKETYHQTDSTGVGLSWMIGNNDGKRFVYHSGKTGIGFSTLCVAYPEDKTGIMILVNGNLSQDNISILSDKIKIALVE